MKDMIRFDCGACGKRLKAPPELAGRRVKCGCGQSQVVPEPLPPDEGDEARTPGPPVPRPKSRKALYVLAGLGLLVLAGVGGWLVNGLLNSRPQQVWVGDLTEEYLAAPAGEGKLWITAYTLDGDRISALVDLSLPKADRDRVEANLDLMSHNAQLSAKMVREGRLIPGSLATRFVRAPAYGKQAVQVALFPFSPSAKKVTPPKDE